MPYEPTLAEVIKGAITHDLAEVMTATVGKVRTYDPVLQVAEIQPVILRPVDVGDGEVEHEELPILLNVPVVFPRGGVVPGLCAGYVLHIPLMPGDHVLLVFTHDSIAMWREKGSVTEPGQLARHSLANAVAFAGIAPQMKPLSPDPTHLAARLGGMYFGEDGTDRVIEFDTLGIKLGHMAIEPVALAPAVVIAFQAIAAWVIALQAALVAAPNVLPLLVGGAMTGPNATLATALGSLGLTVPAKHVKAK